MYSPYLKLQGNQNKIPCGFHGHVPHPPEGPVFIFLYFYTLFFCIMPSYLMILYFLGFKIQVCTACEGPYVEKCYCLHMFAKSDPCPAHADCAVNIL